MPVVFWKVYTKRTQKPGTRRSALSCSYYHGLQRRTARRRGGPGDHRDSRTASPPSSGVPSWWTPCRTGPRSPRPPAGVLHARDRYAAHADAACFQSPEAYYATLFHELSTAWASVAAQPHHAHRPVPLRRSDLRERRTRRRNGRRVPLRRLRHRERHPRRQRGLPPELDAVLRHEPTLLVHAAAQAQKAADYIQNLQPDAGA